MSANNSSIVLIVACCLIAFVAAEEAVHKETLPLPLLVRQVRSPDGSVTVTASQGPAGREAGVQYNQNLYTSRDGRGSVDAYANANRNFDHNRNDYQGGVQARWRF